MRCEIRIISLGILANVLLLALAVWLVLGAAHFGSDAAARAQGRLAEEAMAVTDWQLVGLVQGADGTLTTQDGDPPDDFGGRGQPRGAHDFLHRRI